jgi:hypothetical protein
MKKIFTNLFFLFVIVTMISISFSSCKEDTECKLEIITKLYDDTMMVVPNAVVTLEQGDILVEGSSDLLGRFYYSFPLEAILNVTSKDTTVLPPLKGEGTIRLVPGATVKKTIFIK